MTRGQSVVGRSHQENINLFCYRTSSNNYESKDRAKYSSKDRERYHYGKNSSSAYLQDKTNHNSYHSGHTHYSTPVKDVYSVPVRREERMTSVPHRIIYDTPAPVRGSQGTGSPFTKFRTRIVINSES